MTAIACLYFLGYDGGINETDDLPALQDENLLSWIEHEQAFAEQMNAGTIYSNCGHSIHYYESERISREIGSFVNRSSG